MFKIENRRRFLDDGLEMSVVVVPCCGYSFKRIVILPKIIGVKMCHFYFILETCVCKYLHTLLDDFSWVFSPRIFMHI